MLRKLDEPWLAALCFLETAKARRDRAIRNWEKEIERTELNQRDHERREWEEDCSWWEFLNKED